MARKGRGRPPTCRVLYTCCVLCSLLVHHCCSAQGAKDPVLSLVEKYGNGNTIDHKGLETLLKDLNLFPSEKAPNQTKDHHNHSEVCTDIQAPVSIQSVEKICPSLLLRIVEPSMCSHEHHHEDVHELSGAAWTYATLSIIVISACGLLAVAIIPVMQKLFYQQLIQFLVALAVGTLCGDALLHLLPHAMSCGQHKHESGGHHHAGSEGKDNLWRGFVALVGILLFFFMERCLTVVSEWKRRRQKKNMQIPQKVRVMRDSEQLQGSDAVGEKLCKHKYSSYPYCYDEITAKNKVESGDKRMEQTEPLTEGAAEKQEANSPVLVINQEGKGSEGVAGATGDGAEEGYTVIVREHNRSHHGHSHSHGHVHSAPSSLSSVAWMVIMGDGLHNLTDGLAIGAAFAGSITGGFSTATAVFCHELPHELGDFAVLLKAGMSAKEAICYNLLSSFLCFVGMLIGITLGHSEAAAEWIYSIAAGTFLYIALVDMIPELTNGHSSGSSWLQTLLLQLCGMSLGVFIMMLIASYEEELHQLFDV